MRNQGTEFSGISLDGTRDPGSKKLVRAKFWKKRTKKKFEIQGMDPTRTNDNFLMADHEYLDGTSPWIAAGNHSIQNRLDAALFYAL